MEADALRTLSLAEGWEHYKTVEPYIFEGRWTIPNLRGDFYKKEIGGVVYSYGTFSMRGVPTHRAWGVQAEPHCSYHALYVDGAWGAPIEGCPDLTPIYVGDTITDFTVA